MAASLPSSRRGEIVHQRRITIVQPYLSHYRVPFFRRLAADLHKQLGAELVVAHSSPPPDAVRTAIGEVPSWNAPSGWSSTPGGSPVPGSM